MWNVHLKLQAPVNQEKEKGIPKTGKGKERRLQGKIKTIINSIT